MGLGFWGAWGFDGFWGLGPLGVGLRGFGASVIIGYLRLGAGGSGCRCIHWVLGFGQARVLGKGLRVQVLGLWCFKGLPGPRAWGF